MEQSPKPAEAQGDVAALIERLREHATWLSAHEQSSKTLMRAAAASIASLSEVRTQSDRFCDKYLAALKRAEAAEAKLAEAENDRDRFIEGKVLAEHQRDELRAKLAEAREVVEPFAELAEVVDYFGHEDDSTCEHRIKASALRRARAFRDANSEGDAG